MFRGAIKLTVKIFEPIIFGGTTEGRRLAEFCSEKGIDADVSVATEYGAELLPENINILCGKMDSDEIIKLFSEKKYTDVFDATHPYAVQVTENIKTACKACDIPYYRVRRERSEIYGETVSDIDGLVKILNRCGDIILSTLGGNSAEALTAVSGYRQRLILRVLPSETIISKCIGLGYDEKNIICEKGPFTEEQNISHIKKFGAGIIVSKESGPAGGYAEKANSAKKCGIRMITLVRPDETGYSFDETVGIILNKKEADR